MKKLFYSCCNAFLTLAVLIGSLDLSVMSRDDFYQPPVPEQLLNKQQ